MLFLSPFPAASQPGSVVTVPFFLGFLTIPMMMISLLFLTIVFGWCILWWRWKGTFIPCLPYPYPHQWWWWWYAAQTGFLSSTLLLLLLQYAHAHHHWTDRLIFDLTTIFVFHRAGPDRQPLLHLRPCLWQRRHAVGGHVQRVRGAAGRWPLPGLQRYRARVRPGSYPSSIYLLRRPPRMPPVGPPLPQSFGSHPMCHWCRQRSWKAWTTELGPSTRQKPATQHVVWCWAWDGGPITCFFVFFFSSCLWHDDDGVDCVSVLPEPPNAHRFSFSLFGYIEGIWILINPSNHDA